MATVELPGVAREAIRLHAQGETLTITGEHQQEAESREKTRRLVERVYGKFQRVLGLPTEVDGHRAKATYEQGMLTVRLPKSEASKPREIAIEGR